MAQRRAIPTAITRRSDTFELNDLSHTLTRPRKKTLAMDDNFLDRDIAEHVMAKQTADAQFLHSEVIRLSTVSKRAEHAATEHLKRKLPICPRAPSLLSSENVLKNPRPSPRNGLERPPRTCSPPWPQPRRSKPSHKRHICPPRGPLGPSRGSRTLFHGHRARSAGPFPRVGS